MPKKLYEIMSSDTEDGGEVVLAVDAQGRMHWNGEEVATRQEVTLSGWVNVAIICGGAATVVMALPTVWSIGCAVLQACGIG